MDILLEDFFQLAMSDCHRVILKMTRTRTNVIEGIIMFTNNQWVSLFGSYVPIATPQQLRKTHRVGLSETKNCDAS